MRVCDKFFIYETNNLEYLYIIFLVSENYFIKNGYGVRYN
jgi:hypothetical protein